MAIVKMHEMNRYVIATGSRRLEDGGIRAVRELCGEATDG